MKFLPLLVFGFCLSACQTGNANHLPTPWQLPGAVVGSVFENKVYGAKRKKVESYITQNYVSLTADIHNQGGPFLKRGLDLAHVKQIKRSKLLQELQSRPDIYFAGSPGQNTERLVVAFMVYGGN